MAYHLFAFAVQVLFLLFGAQTKIVFKQKTFYSIQVNLKVNKRKGICFYLSDNNWKFLTDPGLQKCEEQRCNLHVSQRKQILRWPKSFSLRLNTKFLLNQIWGYFKWPIQFDRLGTLSIIEVNRPNFGYDQLSLSFITYVLNTKMLLNRVEIAFKRWD